MGFFDRFGRRRRPAGDGGRPNGSSYAIYLVGFISVIALMFVLRTTGLIGGTALAQESDAGPGNPAAAAAESDAGPGNPAAAAESDAGPGNPEADGEPAADGEAEAAADVEPAAEEPADDEEAKESPAAQEEAGDDEAEEADEGDEEAQDGHAAPADGHGDGHAEGEGDGHAAGGDDHGGGGGHADPVAPILILLTIILLAAKVGGDVFERLKQPSVLGELIFGVLIGNVLFFVPEMPGHELFTIIREGTAPFQVADMIGAGMPVEEAVKSKFSGDAVATFTEIFSSTHGFETVSVARILDALSRLGVIILLFMVGLETNFRDMVKVGVTSFLVAIVGVVAPFGLGFGVSYFAFDDASIYVHLFVGATLCATSVGITARVFKDLKKLQTTEAKIILGAAVIDDVLGLVILAVVAGIITAVAGGEELSGGQLALQTGWITLKAFLFLAASLFLGLRFTPVITNLVSKMRVSGMKLIYALMFAFFLSWLANVIGLAPIVGAFAAGLILDDVHFENFKDEHGHGHGGPMGMEELIHPIAAFLVPIFFIQMGVQVKLETFADVSILGVAAGLTVAAIIGKQVCSLVVREKGLSKISVGIGMIPRGEVGLIFAAIGKELPPINGMKIIDDSTFSAVVIMVIVTTLVTPPLLKIFMDRHYGKDNPAPAADGGGDGDH